MSPRILAAINGQEMFYFIVEHPYQIILLHCEISNWESIANRSLRSEPCGRPTSKACREKVRRDKLNDRYVIIPSVLLGLDGNEAGL
jgi:hypothetical protein